MNPKTSFAPGFSPVERDLISLIGNTPLLPFRDEALLHNGVSFYLKAEWYNPGGSVKDRPVLFILREGESAGELRKGKTILDATSGNGGISYAWMGGRMGYPVKLCIPSNASTERIKLLQILGAELVFTDPLEGTDGARKVAESLRHESPDDFFYPDQYGNPANPLSHYTTTGPEIWNQTEKNITHFVCGLGTTGTFMGCGRFLKQVNPEIRLLTVEPDTPFHGLEGLKYQDATSPAGFYDPLLADEHCYIRTEDAYDLLRYLARKHGLLVGPSSGAAILAGIQTAKKLKEGTIVVLCPDSASRYLSERFWQAHFTEVQHALDSSK